LPLGRRFDLVVGTSTGGIIALGLAVGRTAQEIATFYEKLVPTIFNERAQRSISARISYPKYESDGLKKALDEFFKDATLENVQVDVCITGVVLQTGKPRFYKSLYQNRNIARQGERLADIAMATSAAPTYFKAHNLKSSEKIIDGGICANNPAIVAIVDAINFDRPSITNNARTKNISDVMLVSIGTGEQPSMPYDADTLAEAGLYQWAQHISDVMFESQSIVVDFQAGFLLPGNYLRINPKLGAALALDDVKHLNDLKNISDISRSDELLLKKFFLD
jgi:patatin-like phospholipase/acyl hydrolase